MPSARRARTGTAPPPHAGDDAATAAKLVRLSVDKPDSLADGAARAVTPPAHQHPPDRVVGGVARIAEALPAEAARGQRRARARTTTPATETCRWSAPCSVAEEDQPVDRHRRWAPQSHRFPCAAGWCAGTSSSVSGVLGHVAHVQTPPRHHTPPRPMPSRQQVVGAAPSRPPARPSQQRAAAPADHQRASATGLWRPRQQRQQRAGPATCGNSMATRSTSGRAPPP